MRKENEENKETKGSKGQTKKRKYNNKSRRSNNANSKSYSSKCDDDKAMRNGDVKDVPHISTENDVAWYKNYPELMKDSANIYFTYPLGRDLGLTVPSDLTYAPENYNIPGVMEIDWIPTIGDARFENSAVNIAAREIYNFVRYAQSGSKNYDATDLMMYLLAMDSIYSFYSNMVRAYGTLTLYSPHNRYLPDALLRAQGWNPDELRKNMAQFRWYINQFAYKIGSFAVPAHMTYFERHIWLNSGIYMDEPSNKAQFYVFKQTHDYKYDSTSAAGYLARLVYQEIPEPSDHQGRDMMSAVTHMNALINYVLGDEDFNTISGDILKAFGTDNLFTVSPISEDYVTIPTYSDEVLSQIQNITVLPPVLNSRKMTGYDGMNIVQVGSSEEMQPSLHQWVEFGLENSNPDYFPIFQVTEMQRPLLLSSDEPTIDEVMVATRLMAILNNYEVNGNTMRIQGEAIPTEIVSAISIITIKKDGSLLFESISEPHVNALRPVTFKLSAFNKAPWFYVQSPEAGKDGTIIGNTADFVNYAVMTHDDLKRMHETALYSEFYTPQIAALSRRPYSGK